LLRFTQGALGENLRESYGFLEVHPKKPSAKSKGNPMVFLRVPPGTPQRKPTGILWCSFDIFRELFAKT
jgi:hypothetical protein